VRRGRAWALLGALRLHLLLPAGCADPAAKFALELSHLRAREGEEIGPRGVVKGWEAAAPGSAGGGAEAEWRGDRRELEGVRREARGLEQQLVARPTPPQVFVIIVINCALSRNGLLPSELDGTWVCAS
jgi:hypothetical protein